jgi:hypothetical protein
MVLLVCVSACGKKHKKGQFLEGLNKKYRGNLPLPLFNSIWSLWMFLPTEVPHELAESLAPIEKEIANEQRKPKRRMGAPG